MKRLSELQGLLSPVELIHFEDRPVSGVVCRPEDIREDVLYCVIDEFLQYGHWSEGVPLLASAGSSCRISLLTEKGQPEMACPQVVVKDARKAMALCAKHFYGAPDEEMHIVGITGTNGKTTTTHLVSQLLEACGERSAVLGTLGLFVDSEKRAEGVYTTPLSSVLFETLRELRNDGVSTLSMEISSHALKLDRVFGLDVDVAVLTNLTRDHLDFHETIEDYRASKLSLFTGLKAGGTAVVNGDDDLGKEVLELLGDRCLDYGLSSRSTLQAEDIECSPLGTRFRARCRGKAMEIDTSLVGAFNVSNILAALGACMALGVEWERLRESIHVLRGVPGRMERIPLPGDRVGIVDYAHSPDSLEKVLQTIKGLKPGRIITVFGCGGDRDRGKRPLMGAIAAGLSDLCVVTSDNPRREDADGILRDILAGMPDEPRGKGIMVEPDRRKAIRKAYETSRAGDVILVAGKGHEPYQIIGDEHFPFDDREELRCLA